LNRYHLQIIAVLVALSLLSIALRIMGVRRRAARVAEVEISAELEAAAAAMPPAGPANVIDSAQETPELTPEAKALLLESQDGDAERIRQLAQRDMAATANVLRMWLDQKA